MFLPCWLKWADQLPVVQLFKSECQCRATVKLVCYECMFTTITSRVQCFRAMRRLVSVVILLGSPHFNTVMAPNMSKGQVWAETWPKLDIPMGHCCKGQMEPYMFSYTTNA